ncbi:recombinase family protein [Kocuria tytonicola]|uniref:Recombinase family protein n=1 Tax=Kocuria tytonicola TaxID=2055946 RepID=A0A3L9L2D9_9MICC|nr:recombinase family protein [Kocuria tytonicola]RLY92338.1 recombinase family protein [Kocuria tytonicola]
MLQDVARPAQRCGGRITPGLAEVLGYLCNGEDILVVAWLGRSLADALRTVQELADRGIGLEALDVHLNTSTASGKMMLTLAEWERDLLRERTMEGVARARVAGRRPEPKPKLDEERTAAVRAAVAGGRPAAAVARVRGQPADDIQGLADGERAVRMSGHATSSTGHSELRTSVGEAVGRAQAELATYLQVPENAVRDLARLEGAPNASASASTTWRGLTALADYTRDVRERGFTRALVKRLDQ